MRLRILFVGSLFFTSVAYGQLGRQMAKPVAMIKGMVTATDGSHPSGLAIVFLKGTENVRSTKTNHDGSFSMVLDPDAMYRIVINDPQYMYHEDTLNIPKLSAYQEYPVSSTLTPLRNGQQFTINTPIFLPKATAVDPKGAAEIDRILSELKHNQKLSLAIAVYPDKPVASKKDAAQEKIAAARAANLRTYLIGKGISSSRFEVTTITSTVPPGRFDLGYTNEEPASKKKKKKQAAPLKMLVPQYVEVTARVAG